MANPLIPDITRNPEQWFRYFDKKRAGVLDTQSVIDGFGLTFPSIDKTVLSSIIQEMWPIFDHDGNGTITLQEFLSRDGLCDTLVAQMNPHFNELDAPIEQSPPPSQVHTAPPAYQIPPSNSSLSALQIRCGRCGNLQLTSIPPGSRNFLAVCGTCGAQNQVNL